MSRVHEAIKLAEAKHGPLRVAIPVPREPLPRMEFIVPATSREVEQLPKPMVREFPPELQIRPVIRLSFFGRLTRRVRRMLGMRIGGPVPICSGSTRRGVPCRAPAMANGFCRMHGGSKSLLDNQGLRTNLVRE